ARLLDGGEPAFKKIDSLLRGHVAMELGITMHRFDHCVFAPAFPFQGRITRAGRQLLRHENGGWRDAGVDLPGAVRAWLCDAATDAVPGAMVERGGHGPGGVLGWGTGGLAGALAGHRWAQRPVLPLPILALIGSEHTVSAGQVAVVSARHMQPPDDSI